ncbi:aldo/keto reductase [Pseudomonadota bacterium]|nr:aldo/keto reductase [Pseudomonadota bacterium]
MGKNNTFLNFCLGTVQFGMEYGLKNIKDKRVTIEEVEKIFDYFFSNDGIFVDTASNYGNSEEIISKFLPGNAKLISKYSIYKDTKNIIREVENSLENLGIDELDTAMIHNPDALMQNADALAILSEVKERGLCRNIGISIYSYSDISSSINEISNLIDVIQIPGNAFDNRFFMEVEKRKKTLEEIRVDIRSIFLQGLLLQDIQDSLELFPEFKIDLERWDDYCTRNNLSKMEACIWNTPDFKDSSTNKLFGCRSLKEIKEIFAAVSENFSYKEKFTPSSNINILDPRKWKQK